MRARGWRGDPPGNEEEARARIIEAVGRCVDRHGPDRVGLTDVAEDLGVTRATVYRYFGSLEDLFKATALAAVEQFSERILAHVAHLDDPAEILLESMAYAIERLPSEERVGLLLRSGHTAGMTAEMLSPVARSLTRDLLERLSIDWWACGYRGEDLDGLVELLLRLLRSYLVDPHPRDPRPFLRRWLLPGFAAGRDNRAPFTSL